MLHSKMKKAMTLLMSLALLSLTACSGSGGNSSSQQNSASPSNTATGSAPNASGDSFSYPMSPITLTTNEAGPANIPEWAGDNNYWKALEKATGVTLKTVKGEMGKAEEFNLMLASGDLPDLVLGNWLTYPGGPEQAMRQGLILQLNDMVDQYAPNLKAKLTENPDYEKYMKTDEGKYYAFPFFRNEETTSFYGLAIRTDKLQKHNLTAPETIDELYTVLKTFKSDPECQVPITFEYRFQFLGDQGYGSTLQNVFGLKSGFWVEDGKVMHGESQPAYKDYLTLMNQWYQEGLIDPDMPSIDKATALAKFSSGTAWATMLMTNQANDTILANKDDPNFKFEALSSPVKNKGDKPKFGQKQNIYPGIYCMAVSAKSKNKEAAVRVMDYMYSEEGLKLSQYGIEGYTYVMKDGKVSYEDPSLPPLPEGTTITDRLSATRRPTNWPTIQIGKEYSQSPEVYDMVDKWAYSDALDYIIPPITYTSEESAEFAKIYTDLDTYLRENVVKFIIGEKPISEFDAFVEGMKKFSLDRAIAIVQSAVDRYNSR